MTVITGAVEQGNVAEPSLDRNDAAISIHGLTKKFGNITAVNQISLDIKKGELFGLLGANGAGKSTIIKMLTTMLAPNRRRSQSVGP